jgi:1-deoxy-D-xylulose 5-phosphate reductoisomerase
LPTCCEQRVTYLVIGISDLELESTFLEQASGVRTVLSPNEEEAVNLALKKKSTFMSEIPTVMKALENLSTFADQKMVKKVHTTAVSAISNARIEARSES